MGNGMVGKQQRERFRKLCTEDAYRAAWRYACRLSASREDAEDLLQEALVRALMRIHQLREPSLFKGWLFRIVRTRYIDIRRQARTKPPVFSNQVDNASVHELNASAELVREALTKLPAAQRETLMLFHYDELSLAETAQVLNITIGAVKQRLGRARAALKAQLKHLISSSVMEAGS